jgi:hypothetical protein
MLLYGGSVAGTQMTIAQCPCTAVHQHVCSVLDLLHSFVCAGVKLNAFNMWAVLAGLLPRNVIVVEESLTSSE